MTEQSSIRHPESHHIDTFRDGNSSEEEGRTPMTAPAPIGHNTAPIGYSPEPGTRRYVAPMTASAHTVAAALHARKLGLGASRLNSLLYFCQGHHLGEMDEPLFAEPLYAVANGAIVETFAGDDTEPLAVEQLNTVGYVISRYGNLSAADLRALIWAGDPWKLAAARPEDARIERAWLQDWFGRAAWTGELDEPQLTRQQITELAARISEQPPGAGKVDTRESIQARIDAARRRAAGAS